MIDSDHVELLPTSRQKEPIKIAIINSAKIQKEYPTMKDATCLYLETSD